MELEREREKRTEVSRVVGKFQGLERKESLRVEV